MVARNAKWTALFLAAALISCSQQDELISDAAVEGEEIVTSVNVNVPRELGTRTVTDVYSGDGAQYLGTSGMPSIGNVDLEEHHLTYTVGVYIEKKKASADEAPAYALVDKQCHTGADDNAYFEFRLLKGQKYRLVAYADFSGAEKTDLETISYTTRLNDELSDAFFASEDFHAEENVEVVLKRPFGKLRLIARDFNTLAAGEAFKVTKVTVAYKGAPMLATDTFNALTGDFNYDKDANGDHTVEAAPAVYTQEYIPTADGKIDYASVFTMYLPANFGDGDDSGQYIPDHSHSPVPQSWFYPFDVTVEYENANDATVNTIERSFAIDIPVKRNWLTTVDATHFWTDNSGVMVTVHAAFDGPINIQEEEQATVKTAADLQKVITKICKEAPEGKTTVAEIVLGADINVGELSSGGLMFDTYPNDMKKTVEIHLDLNNHTIYSSKVNPSPNSAAGLVSIYSRNTILHIDDTSKEANGGIEYRGSDRATGYPLVSCVYGGQVVINRGTFKSTADSPVVYVYELESQRAAAQIEILKALGIQKVGYPNDETVRPDFTPEQVETIERILKQLTSTATINGGWFENAQDSSTPVDKRVIINAYNVRPAKWEQYHDSAYRKGYPAWTDWGEYVNQVFGFVHVNGGSFVEFDPSRGDNIVGNQPIKWIGNGHVQEVVVDGKTVYTVIPEDEVHEF